MTEIGTDFGADSIAEDDGAGQTCWRSIGDRYLTMIDDYLDQSLSFMDSFRRYTYHIS